MKIKRIPNYAMKEYLLKHGEEHIIKEWVDIINEKFEENYSLNELRHYFVRHHIPYKYEMETKSNNGLAHPVGSERVKPDGMVQIKVGDHKWMYKQRYIYEQYYDVELAEDEYIIFLDQNRNNFDISNLKKVSRRESAVMAHHNLFSNEPATTELGISVAKLMNKTKDVKDERE